MEMVMNLSQPQTKAALIRSVQCMEGPHRISIVKYRKRRSDAQNKYLWGALYPMVAQGISAQWGETMTADEAHEFLKLRFLRKPVVDRTTGTQKGWTVPTTTALSTAEFAEYVEKIAAFAAEQLGIVIPEPGLAGAEN
jgi:hypothetical protein